MNFRVIVVTILMLLVGQKYTYADGNTTNVYIFRHGRVNKQKTPLELKKESETEIRNSAEKISCDSDTSRNYKIFYLLNDGPEEESKRFKQTAVQIDAGLNKSCNFNRDIKKQHISVTDSRNPDSDDLQKVWNKITDDSLNYYNKIFVLSGEVIKALLKPNSEQCPSKNAPCFMENWQAVHDVVEDSKSKYNSQYNPNDPKKKETDFLYTMILHLQLHGITKPYNSISPVDTDTITICSKPPDHPESPLDCPPESNNQ